MKHIQNYNNFNHIDEGWKQNLLTGALLALSSIFTNVKGQDATVTNPNGSTTVTKNLKDSSYIKDYLREGWTLDAVKIDTIFKDIKEKAPKTEVITRRLKVDKNLQFNSGDFSLSETLKHDIDSVMGDISNNNYLLIKIDIISSTDKQGVSQNLQKTLSRLGYEPNNTGLSKARSESVSEYLESEFSVNDSLITTCNLVEKGGEIDKDARYVVVDFHYLEKADATAETKKEIESTSKTYVMKKTYEKPTGEVEKDKKGLKLSLPNLKINLGSIGGFQGRGSVGCPMTRFMSGYH